MACATSSYEGIVKKKCPKPRAALGLELVQQSVSEDDRPVTIVAGANFKINER
jgi:hypothetical protein